jgi:site-specific DNA-methyltransferase (adenine-specific)
MSDPWKKRVEIGNAVLYLGDCLEILPTLKADAIITDPPYSERTHKVQCVGEQRDGLERRALDYAAWTAAKVDAFIERAVVACNGWIACMCDDVLAPAYDASLRCRGRYVFAPLPYFAPGSRVRLSGDGPSSWTIWMVVARTKAQHKWGTLPGGYLRQPGWDAPEKQGGKPVKLMAEIVGDYSREGQIVCDPCMGRATTAIAALTLGRQFIGIEQDPEEFERACARLRDHHKQQNIFGDAYDSVSRDYQQQALFP